MNIHDPLHRTSQGDWHEVRNRNSYILAPVIVPAISYIGSSSDVEHTTVNIFLSWGFRLTQLPCFEHNQFVCFHYSLVRAHITVSIYWQEQKMQALSRTVRSAKCCELLLEETWSPNMHLTILLQVELFSWSPPSIGRNFFFHTTVVPDL